MIEIQRDDMRFIPPDERWEDPWNDNKVREGRDEYYVNVLGVHCPKEGCKQLSCNEHSDGRDLSAVRITRNYETQKFVLYLDDVAVLEARWADTPSGRGPNGHSKMLERVRLFARGWMAAECEVPVQDVHLHVQDPSDD